MPVILNEPTCALQRNAEGIILGFDLFEEASQCEDPVERLCLIMIGLATAFSTTKYRKKKPFNPMLGETYEFVSDKLRYFTEKVMHIPHQIVAWEMEG